MYSNSKIKITKKKKEYFLTTKGDSFFINTAFSVGQVIEPIPLRADKITCLTDLINKHLELPDRLKLCELLFVNLMTQLKLLEKNNQTIISFEPEHIFLIQSEYFDRFVFLNVDAVCNTTNNNIIIEKPFKITKYTAPELKRVKKVPNIKHFKTTAYWSLGSLISGIINMDDITYTKLFWAVKKSLIKEPERRFLIMF